MKILEHLGKWVTVHYKPKMGWPYVNKLEPGHVLVVDENMYPDDKYPNDIGKLWYKIIEGPYAGWYVNAIYPPNGARYKEIKPLPEDDADYYYLIGLRDDYDTSFIQKLRNDGVTCRRLERM